MDDVDDPVCWKTLDCMATIRPEVQLQILSVMGWNVCEIQVLWNSTEGTAVSVKVWVMEWCKNDQVCTTFWIKKLASVRNCQKNKPSSSAELSGELEDLLAVWAGRSTHFGHLGAVDKARQQALLSGEF